METKTRCGWCLSSDIQNYHDQEWGTAVYDDATLVFLILETFQAGLSWITILNKENFRKAFDNFDYKIAQYPR
jgi:DNA-3-methyladenine glycosylase I